MNEGQKEQFQSTIEIGLEVLKTSILINGGAAIALLTFLGNANASLKTMFLVSTLKLSKKRQPINYNCAWRYT